MSLNPAGTQSRCLPPPAGLTSTPGPSPCISSTASTTAGKTRAITASTPPGVLRQQ